MTQAPAPMTSPAKPPRTLTDTARKYSQGVLQPVGKFLHQRHVHPDMITLVGFGVVIVAAIAIALNQLFLGGILLVVGLPLDALDGTVARLRGDVAQRPFGGFLDSTLDRYADGLIFGALVYYGKEQGSDTIIFLSLVAMVGSFMVSYTRARAEGLGLECKIGLFTRMERLVSLLVLLFTGWVIPMLWVLAIGTQFTALQRMWHVRKISTR